MKRDDLPFNPSATFVLPQWKTVYVSVPKAACTTVKWLLSDLQGEDPQRFYDVVSLETSRSMMIHHRTLWQKTPTLHSLSDEQLEAISPEAGWFVFSVVRHPALRLFSGWQSKYLLHEPWFTRLDYELPFPELPTTTERIVEDFHSFVRFLEDHPRSQVAHDRHFRSQVRLLRPQRLAYSRIYRTEQWPSFVEDFRVHLERLGMVTMPEVRRSNETPLPPLRAMFPDEIVRSVVDRYAADFTTFGYDEQPPRLASAEEYSPQSLGEVVRLVERSERIGDLFDSAQRSRAGHRETKAKLLELRAEYKQTRRELRAERRTVRQLQAAFDALPSTRLRRRAGSLRRRVRGGLSRMSARARG